MFKINDYIIYNNGVCKIKDIKKKYMNDTDYFIVCPIEDESLTIKLPITTTNMRKLINVEEAEELISKIPSIETLNLNEKNIEIEYKKLLENKRLEDLVKIIKTTYLRNKERTDNKKKTGDIDNKYFSMAEKFLYNELALVYNKSFDDIKNDVIEKVTNKEAL